MGFFNLFIQTKHFIKLYEFELRNILRNLNGIFFSVKILVLNPSKIGRIEDSFWREMLPEEWGSSSKLFSSLT